MPKMEIQYLYGGIYIVQISPEKANPFLHMIIRWLWKLVTMGEQKNYMDSK